MNDYISRVMAIARLTKVEVTNKLATMTDAKRVIAEMPAADGASVVHGRWIFTKRHLWYKDENGNIDEWRCDNGFHNGPECQICHTAFCEHCTPVL